MAAEAELLRALRRPEFTREVIHTRTFAGDGVPRQPPAPATASRAAGRRPPGPYSRRLRTAAPSAKENGPNLSPRTSSCSRLSRRWSTGDRRARDSRRCSLRTRSTRTARRHRHRRRHRPAGPATAGGETTAGGILPASVSATRAGDARDRAAAALEERLHVVVRRSGDDTDARIAHLPARDDSDDDGGSRRTRASPFFASRSSPTRDVVVVVGGG